MTARVTYRRRHSYASRSNTVRKLKTPGGKLVVQYTAKKARGPQTPVGDQGRIHGVRSPCPPAISGCFAAASALKLWLGRLHWRSRRPKAANSPSSSPQWQRTAQP